MVTQNVYTRQHNELVSNPKTPLLAVKGLAPSKPTKRRMTSTEGEEVSGRRRKRRRCSFKTPTLPGPTPLFFPLPPSTHISTATDLLTQSRYLLNVWHRKTSAHRAEGDAYNKDSQSR